MADSSFGSNLDDEAIRQQIQQIRIKKMSANAGPEWDALLSQEQALQSVLAQRTAFRKGVGG